MKAALPPLRRAHAARYVTPLREGGSLPAIVETDAGDLVVAKFRGAGQGPPVLVAEIVVAALAQAAGLNVPEIVLLDLDDSLARTERDEEIGDLLRASAGLNIGLGYLAGSVMFDAAAADDVDPRLAASIVMFDAFVTNVDRTARNPNLLWWRQGLWLIDHGAALYWHHGWDGPLDAPARSFPLVRSHVLLPWAADLEHAAADLLAAFDDELLQAAVARVPADLLPGLDPIARRGAYTDFLRARRDAPDAFIEEAVRARRAL
jgi:hypothetical protein